MTRTERIAALKAAAKERILILDGSWPAMTRETAVRASDTTLDAVSLTGISSSRMAGGMSGRVSVIRRSSVRWSIPTG